MQSRLRSIHHLRVPSLSRYAHILERLVVLCRCIRRLKMTLAHTAAYYTMNFLLDISIQQEPLVGKFRTYYSVEVCLQESSGILTLLWCLHITLSFLVSRLWGQDTLVSRSLVPPLLCQESPVTNLLTSGYNWRNVSGANVRDARQRFMYARRLFASNSEKTRQSDCSLVGAKFPTIFIAFIDKRHTHETS